MDDSDSERRRQAVEFRKQVVVFSNLSRDEVTPVGLRGVRDGLEIRFPIRGLRQGSLQLEGEDRQGVPI